MPLKPDAIQRLEKQLGRKLNAREILFEEVDRNTPATGREMFDAQAWKPKVKTAAPKSPYSDAISEAERTERQTYVMSLTPEKRRLEMLKDAERDHVAKEQATMTRDEYLAKVQPQVAMLREKELAARLDPSVSFAELNAIRRAIAQIEVDGSDPDATAEILAEVRELEVTRRTSKREEIRTQEQQLAAQREQIDRELVDLGRFSQNPILATLKTAAQAWEHYSKTYGADTEEKRPEALAARDYWIELDRQEQTAAANSAE